MNKIELKKIPIIGLLEHLGYHPVKQGSNKNQLMYHSPLREDRIPSFSVSIKKNLWNDYGLGRGGNVIDLAIALNGNCTFRHAAEWLEEQFHTFKHGGNSDSIKDWRASLQFVQNPKRSKECEFRDVAICTLTNPALLSYVLKRGISLDLAVKYCKEVHYTVYNKPYFGICFQNILGGMEIRNPFFKGCYGNKAPSVIPVTKERKTRSCCVFEGFMDFLSYLQLQRSGNIEVVQEETLDYVVLNSTSMVNQAITFLTAYPVVFCYLDNDESGKSAFQQINHKHRYAKDMSHRYQGYKDINGYLMSNIYESNR